MANDYLHNYKKVLTGHKFYKAVRMTVAMMLPVLVAAYYNQLSIGAAIAFGVFCVSLTDNPGPIHHRTNGMRYAIGFIFVCTLITGFCVPYFWLMLLLLATLPFLLSMIGVYGARAADIGSCTLLMVLVHVDKTLTMQQILLTASYAAAGGIWYYLLSLLLHRLRPYKLVQQVLADCMLKTAAYLRIKASFYNEHVDYDKSYHALMEGQVAVHQTQQAAREIIYNTRAIVKESTQTSRALVMAFIDTLDLFERIMTSQQEYKMLHQHFDGTGLLPVFQHSILQLSADLEHIAVGMQEGREMEPNPETALQLAALEDAFADTRKTLLNEDNIEAFISLRHILDSIKDLQSRIDALYRYSNGDLQLPKSGNSHRYYKKFLDKVNYSPKLFLENLNFQSNIFRHSIRVSLALVAGYILASFLPFGHDYWILVTTAVILKPAFSLTRIRNTQRIAGTLMGLAIGWASLYWIKDAHLLVGIVVVSMLVAFTMMKTNYLVSVIFMTVCIIIAFHFYKETNINHILKERLIDTIIGSGICLLFTFIIPPRWEKQRISEFLTDATKANADYFGYIGSAYTGAPINDQQYKLYRKETFVTMANLADAFQRMMNEPKSKQKHGGLIHQLVVSNHMLSSHIATLSSYVREFGLDYVSKGFQPIIDNTLLQLNQAQQWLNHTADGTEKMDTAKQKPLAIKQQVDELMEQRQYELRQGSLETATRYKLSDYKTILDQFEIILRLSEDICGISRKLSKEV